ATMRARSLQAWDSSVLVVKPARRIFNTPENQALLWVLERLDSQLRSVQPIERDREAIMTGASWFEQILDLRHKVTQARRQIWLRGVEAQRPNSRTRKALQAARSEFYKLL